MFEKFTERARRVIFFARYEASSFGSTSIESEHLLLGLLREKEGLLRPFSSMLSSEMVRSKILAKKPEQPVIATSVDLPLSDECTRILAYAAEESDRLAQKEIGTEHLLLGLLREEGSLAWEILSETGMRVDVAREQLGALMKAQQSAQANRSLTRRLETSLDLTPSSMRVLMLAQTQAERVIGQQITVEHLLLGLLSDEPSSALEILRVCGLRVEDALERLRRNDLSALNEA